MFRRFLNRFADNFGAEVRARRPDPQHGRAADLSRRHGPRELPRPYRARGGHLRPRSLELRYPRGHRVLFGEAFAIYPWMLDRRYEDVIGSTPAILGTHEALQLQGTIVARPVSHTARPRATSTTHSLRRSWRAGAGATRPHSPRGEDVALMRSLNMAYHASLLPAGTDTTFYDVGRVVSLWVSAFEILVHPGGSGQANRDKVFEMVERTPWAIPASSQLVPRHGWQDQGKAHHSILALPGALRLPERLPPRQPGRAQQSRPRHAHSGRYSSTQPRSTVSR
jgi:hypothetical protein